ncbi:MAG: hypothetical protein AAGF98_06940, partial [Cyanobacteria bacterium P01_H01_bin.153]
MSWIMLLRSWLVLVCLFACLMGAIASPARADTVRHPLDALTSNEYETALTILQDQGLVNADSRYPFMRLQPPTKDTVLAWQPGEPFERSAFAMV